MIDALHSIGMSNGMITSAVITIILCAVSIVAGRRLQTVPSGFQNFAEWAIESLYNFFSGIMGDKACRRYFPLVARCSYTFCWLIIRACCRDQDI